MAGKKTEDKARRVIVIPRTNDAMKENFVKVNGKVVPFDVPIVLEPRDIRVLNEMKEPVSVDADVNVYEIMDQMQISQEQANKIAQARAVAGNGKRIKWVPKFSVMSA